MPYPLKKVLVVFACICVIVVSGCSTKEQLAYYADRNNYITATGTVTHIAYSDDNTVLYIGFSDISHNFSDNCFKIVGKNLKIAQERGIDEILGFGIELTFISAPRYFGDGYVMPIVALCYQNKIILEFNEGYSNLLSWLEE